MPSREDLNLQARSLGIDPANYQNDSVLEQRVTYLKKNASAVTGTVGTGTLTSTGVAPADGDIVTIGSTVYRFKTTSAQAYDVAIGASAAAALDNLKAAINATGTPGTEYFAGTHAHPEVTATTNTDTTQVVDSRYFQVGDVATTETSAQLSWGAATLQSDAPKVVASVARDVAAVSDGQPV